MAFLFTGSKGEFAKDELKIDGKIVHGLIPVSFNLAAASAAGPVFVADDNYEVAGVKVVFGTASTSGTLQLEKLTGTEALGAGTALLSATVSLAGTADTVVAGTPAGVKLAAGDRIATKLAGTMTGLATCVVTVYLKRV